MKPKTEEFLYLLLWTFPFRLSRGKGMAISVEALRRAGEQIHSFRMRP